MHSHKHTHTSSTYRFTNAVYYKEEANSARHVIVYLREVYGMKKRNMLNFKGFGSNAACELVLQIALHYYIRY